MNSLIGRRGMEILGMLTARDARSMTIGRARPGPKTMTPEMTVNTDTSVEPTPYLQPSTRRRGERSPQPSRRCVPS
jgi:hypothetical protein